jgi:low affinity Fe/Cu permease
MNEGFRKAARYTSGLVGSAPAFMLAFLVVLVWAVSGPFFHFADTWQLVINTGTTIVTFLMVFLIQNTQNRDSRAMHMKLDELVLYTKGADNSLVDTEGLSDEQLDRLEQHYHALARALGKEEVADDAPNGKTPGARSHSHRKAAATPKSSSKRKPAPKGSHA